MAAMYAHRLDFTPSLPSDHKIAGLEQARVLFEPLIAGLDREIIVVAYLRNDLSVDFVSFYEGEKDGADINMRKLLRDVCLTPTPAILVAHNHPSGDSTASRSDKIWTKHLYEVLEALDVVLLDHIIFANGSAPFSFRHHGLI